MKLLLLFVVIATSTSLVRLQDNTGIENLYIDILVQRYLLLESDLWTYIYMSGAKIKDLIAKIRTDHRDFLANNGLSDVMNRDYRSKFEKFLNFTEFDDYVGEDTALLTLLQQRDGYDSGFSETSETIKRNFNRTISEDLFKAIKEEAENRNCANITTRVIEPASQDLFMFYEIVTASMLISYATTQRKNMVQVVKRGFEKHDYTILRNDFNTRYGRIAALARENIQTSSKVIWMCDSLSYTEDDESIQITNFLTGYIDNEINLNEDGSCWNTCADYSWTESYRCYDGTFCDRERRMGHVAACNGTILDCSYIEASMLICQSADINSNRRYDNIKFESGLRFGQHPCTARPTEVSSWWNSYLLHCSYCFCYCDSHGNSDRYFSLQPAVSTIRKNKIITGVGIVKHNGIFSWLIIQSKLLSNGRVQQNTYNDAHDNQKISHDERELVAQAFSRSDFGIVEGVDYFTLSWQNRSVNLDTITVPPGCVLTGVRFTVAKEDLNFQIRYTQFNFNTGQLYGRSQWISSKTERRSVLLLNRPAPSRPASQFETKRSVPDWTPNKFIKFRPSDPEKDAGQTTVPFIDNQIVRPKELTLLSGVGLYHKGLPGFGGFIAPKLIVYDMSPYVGN